MRFAIDVNICFLILPMTSRVFLYDHKPTTDSGRYQTSKMAHVSATNIREERVGGEVKMVKAEHVGGWGSEYEPGQYEEILEMASKRLIGREYRHRRILAFAGNFVQVLARIGAGVMQSRLRCLEMQLVTYYRITNNSLLQFLRGC
jgi:hypothetical protein